MKIGACASRTPGSYAYGCHLSHIPLKIFILTVLLADVHSPSSDSSSFLAFFLQIEIHLKVSIFKIKTALPTNSRSPCPSSLRPFVGTYLFEDLYVFSSLIYPALPHFNQSANRGPLKFSLTVDILVEFDPPVFLHWCHLCSQMKSLVWMFAANLIPMFLFTNMSMCLLIRAGR